MWPLCDLTATPARRERANRESVVALAEGRIHIVLFCFGLLVCVCIYIDQFSAECVFTLNTCNVVCVAGNGSSMFPRRSLKGIK